MRRLFLYQRNGRTGSQLAAASDEAGYSVEKTQQDLLLLFRRFIVLGGVLKRYVNFKGSRVYLKILMSPEMVKPKFSFGIITDVQYADIPDGHSFGGVPRYYRHSLEALGRAIGRWDSQGGLAFVVHLGDIIDGNCPRKESYNAICRVIETFKRLQDVGTYHVLGNHCLYNLPRDDLHRLLEIPSENGTSYYTFVPTTGFRVVVLDGYDISVMGWPLGHPHRDEALRILKEKNPNGDMNSPAGLVGLERRFVMFNGGVGRDQLTWLHQVLELATHTNEKVIICSHIPLHPEVTSCATLLWNYNDVLDVIYKFSCVKVCFSGHTHCGGYTVDSHGVHHHVLDAVLECPPGTDAFGHIDVYDDRLSLVGVGCVQSIDMYFHA